MKTLFLGFGLLASAVSFAQKEGERLQRAFTAFAADEQFKHAIISLYVVDTKTGKTVFDKNAELGLAPASSQKVITSAAAFELLGKDYRYQTVFGYDGTIANGILQGNLVIKASGDPTFGSFRWPSTEMNTVLQQIAVALKAAGIKTVTGQLVVDDAGWSTQATPGGWTWDDMGNYYGAGARMLNWNENQYDLKLKPGKKAGDSVEITGTVPELPVPILNELLTGKAGSGDRSVIYLPEHGSVGFVRGTVGTEVARVSGSIPVVQDVFLAQLKKYLQENDIGFTGKIIQQPMPITAKTILNFPSPAFDSINYWFLQKSVNLFGEAFIKTIAFQKKGFGSTDSGVNIIRDFWEKNGIEKSALNILDGSGLSPANRVTTHALVTVMQYAKKQPWYPAFYEALPLQNGIKMKSGYIGGARSYTGYVSSKSGAGYTFAFIINNYDGSPVTVREKMWKLLDNLK